MLRALAPLLLLCLPASPAAAQMLENGVHGGTLEVPVNKSQVVSADQPIARAMVGNAEIADIVPLTDRSVYVLGKAMGTTSLTLYDRGGRVLVVMDIAVGPDAQGYRDQLARLVPAAQIDAQISGNSLILTGMANDPGAIDRAVMLARTYAGENVVNMVGLGASQQVMLEVKFAEVRREIGEDIGVRGFASDGDFRSAFGGGGGEDGASSITVEFKPFGVSLGFTPTVLGDGTINLRVEPEVSAIDPAASLQLNGISIPGLQTRRASTTLELRDGESFAIAGLLQRDFQTTINQVPLLGGIPILGALFRSTEFQKGETELLIVVTPRLVAPIRPSQVRLPTDRVKDPDVGAAVLLGEAYDPVPAGEVAGERATGPAEGSGDYEY